jgi:DNA polymerase-3 subunit epsilon
MMDVRSIKQFTSVDVELANNDLHSICEIGVARFREGILVETWRAIINPECSFEKVFHSGIHGLREKHACQAPIFPEVHDTLARYLRDGVCIYHAASDFDRNCIRSACARYGLDDVTQHSDWFSTLDLARYHWPEESNHKLQSLCQRIGYGYEPHNALEDAMACAQLFLTLSGSPLISAIAPSGEAGQNRPRTFRRVASQKRRAGLKGSEEGPFAGTFIVYSGEFAPPWDDRLKYDEFLCGLGFTPRQSISGRTSLLVIAENPGPKELQTALEQGMEIMEEAEFFQMIEAATGCDYSQSTT